MGCRWRADCPYEGKHDIERFEKLEDLWRAHDERKAEMASAEESREKKVQANPYHYICAGCGLEGTHRSGLQRCGGKCSKQWKPAYCSRDCQRLDWKRHKPFCRSEGAADAWAMSLQRSAPGSDSRSVPYASSTLEPSYIARSYTDVASRKYERRVTTLAPDGRTIQIASSTMTPSSMRELRDVLLRDSLVL
ncbi:hypothetical protein PHLGIDRAFT_22738 [Phlebiopsis gigantea 11061_1 CR5-6]|uniref:MYND-type domain-containing protein n=1 Tax=Phlebiopsis gigantea (strain 11061_1 CR5-6) TaxID=745531 RepID=A0A0C3SB70_PHLG1|nr:hypothetical protein PHLGIDRAFT_22738 [Phlebiopsis gigantea 11061_1 CR5-6]